MTVALNAYPQPRTQRTPPGASPAPPPAVAQVPRMRIFSLARDAHANVNNVMISPRCQGPAIIKDIILAAPNAIWGLVRGVKIYISDNNGGGVVDSAVTQTPTGDVIFEDMTFKYNGVPPAQSPFLHGEQAVHTLAGARTPGTVIPLDYPVNRAGFYIKVYVIGENQALEGHLRVLEGVDLARFF